MAAGITLCGSLSRWAVGLGSAMHEAGYRSAGLHWRYVPFEVDDLPGALAAMRALSIRGFGISMPFKEQIIEHLDRVDPLAARIGAVNTVVNDEGELVGYNTDAVGARRALEEVLALRGAPVVVLGTGGAAKAVVRGLQAAGATVEVCGRSEDKAKALAGAASIAARPWAQRNALGGLSAVVNATACGMAGVDTSSPLAEQALHPELVVMDIVYKPLDTRLLADAAARGARAIHGGRMLLHQAATQFELYTGRAAPLGAMDAALRRAMAAEGAAPQT